MKTIKIDWLLIGRGNVLAFKKGREGKIGEDRGREGEERGREGKRRYDVGAKNISPVL